MNELVSQMYAVECRQTEKSSPINFTTSDRRPFPFPGRNAMEPGLLVSHQLLHGGLDILALRQDEILDLRGICDKGVGRTDAADGCVEVFE